MKKLLRPKWQNEDGAISLEFLGILPFFFLFFLLLWQVVGTGYAVFTAKTAANDAAKTYAATNDLQEAIQTAQESIGSSSVLSYKNLIREYSSNGDFKLVLYAEHKLSFVPDRWREQATFELDEEAFGKVLYTE
ncbi:pilus assembly protein [Cytobacillus gottheilii]|uniref:Pilus assembly protein n=1 Tax=Cytobacillus gottheilii TaxID=859144 RepID=A0ABX8FCB3_9BACI|nr:pilus assembly protein [Cytobacillus gottheilii]QVY62015.1 pilus assembly protein [Cytobacillus gottheilii]